MLYRNSKHIYREKIKNAFVVVKKHPYYRYLVGLPFSLRLILASLLMIVGIVALLTPIPFGWLMLTAAGVLLFGIKAARRVIIQIFFLLRLHLFVEWVRRKWKR